MRLRAEDGRALSEQPPASIERSHVRSIARHERNAKSLAVRDTRTWCILQSVVRSRSTWVFLTCSLGILGGALASGLRASQEVTFDGDVLPIFKAHCVTCHGGDDPSGELDLTSAEGLKKSNVVVPGKPEESRLVQRLQGLGGRPRMPKGFGPLAQEDIDKVVRWIRSGASYAGGKSAHWAYLLPVRPAIPEQKGAQGKWIRNPIDAFVLKRLQDSRLEPSPEAPKEVLLRRVYLDLIGLPPSPREVQAFLGDKRPDAYERVVDRLLANPHYGEKRALKWLDLARYADTNGYEKDGIRTAWKYRDWVIDAFNANMPYDQFTIKQLAGDLLPNPSINDLVATGFHRNSMFNAEGGVDQEEARYEVINDRVATTATVWLGTSLACARCHDHKYDPFTQRDYFRMYAFFNNTDYQEVGNKTISEMKYVEPVIEVPNAEQAASRMRLVGEIAALRGELKTRTPALTSEESAWIQSLRSNPAWRTLAASVKATGGIEWQKQSDDSWLAQGPNADQSTITVVGYPNQVVSVVKLEVLPDNSLVNGGPGRASSGNFILSSVRMWADGKPVPTSGAEADYVQQGYSIEDVLDEDPDTGWAVAGSYGKEHVAAFRLTKPIHVKELRVQLECASRMWPQHTLGRFRLSCSDGAAIVAELVPAPIREIAGLATRTPDEQKRLDDFFLSVAPSLNVKRRQLQADERQLDTLNSEIPTALILREKKTSGPLTAWLRKRGDFLNKSEEVTASTPAVLPPLKDPAPNRLSLAKWLVSKENPLTARVEVNRLWEECFGRGIVETSENFGTQGSHPSHPELLDWLACEFVDRGWDMKAILRLIVTSSTYRQSSSRSKDLLAKDPENVLLARGPRFRLDAEGIRDVALTASGLLNPQIGGPSVFPYQPEGIWNSPYSGERWMTSKGSSLYRRGIYTFLKRTAMYPNFMALDGTSREQCTVRRTRTNTPLQSLALLNDQTSLEAAKALARRTLRESKGKARIDYAFELCTGRIPTREEKLRLEKLLSTLTARYSARSSDATKLSQTPELAAWTLLANVLLNLDETITKS